MPAAAFPVVPVSCLVPCPGHHCYAGGGCYAIVEHDRALNRSHLSVSARGRRPTDAQLQRFREALLPSGRTFVERSAPLNPYVRHLFEAEPSVEGLG